VGWLAFRFGEAEIIYSLAITKSNSRRSTPDFRAWLEREKNFDILISHRVVEYWILPCIMAAFPTSSPVGFFEAGCRHAYAVSLLRGTNSLTSINMSLPTYVIPQPTSYARDLGESISKALDLLSDSYFSVCFRRFS
jgi:hypothetical protein